MKTKTDSVAERLKVVRTALNLSQRAFAKGVFVSQSYFGDNELLEIQKKMKKP